MSAMEPKVQDPQLKEVLRETLNAVDRLLNLFRVERLVHLVIGAVAFLLLLYAVVLLVRQDGVSTSLLLSLFGSSGLITLSSARITYFFNKAFRLIEDIIRVLVIPGSRP
ncbi:MAG TPA: hypothetical protein VHG51_13610 [Longimicrobiaceae bacterium]|nr:hypothetical protein [Longimicrobiaceae bacterium]